VDLPDSVPAIFLIGMMLPDVLISAAGTWGIRGKERPRLEGDMYYFGGGNRVLKKKDNGIYGNVLPFNDLKLRNLLLFQAIGTIQGKEKTALTRLYGYQVINLL
jgi:hypothetical protein